MISARLFRPFQQAEQHNSRKYGGTGLGLSIVRKLTELMDGEVWAKSTLGEGSEFFYAFRSSPMHRRQFHLIQLQTKSLCLQTIKQCERF